MRFLFGDSTPFPLGYNFLATLEVFMTAATRVVQLDQDSQRLARQADEAAQARVSGLEVLEQFHGSTMRMLSDASQKVQHPLVLEYAQHLSEYAARHVEDHRRSVVAANDQDAMQLRAEGERIEREQRSALEAFLKVARFPVASTKLQMRLEGEGKDAHYEGSASFETPDGIHMAFTLAPSRAAPWAAPKRVVEVAQGVELHVGVEKSWLRGTVTAKALVVDDWVITHLDASDDMLELALRRRLSEKESLHFSLRRTEAGVLGRVEYPGQSAGGALPTNLAPADVAQLERLWLGLRTVTRDVLDQKEQLVVVNLDGQSVFESGRASAFVARLVASFAPMVLQIADRSPSEFELSLKMETEGGRREELYLRKEQLLERLAPLTSSGRAVFAPLGLDTWVPGVTSAPPVVAVGPE